MKPLAWKVFNNVLWPKVCREQPIPFFISIFSSLFQHTFISGVSLPSTSCLCPQIATEELQNGVSMEQQLSRPRAAVWAPLPKTKVGERISWQIRILLIKKAGIFHGEAGSFKSCMTWQPKEPFSCTLVNSAGRVWVVRACASWISEPLDGFVLRAKWGTTA